MEADSLSHLGQLNQPIGKRKTLTYHTPWPVNSTHRWRANSHLVNPTQRGKLESLLVQCSRRKRPMPVRKHYHPAPYHHPRPTHSHSNYTDLRIEIYWTELQQGEGWTGRAAVTNSLTHWQSTDLGRDTVRAAGLQTTLSYYSHAVTTALALHTDTNFFPISNTWQ